MTLSCREDARSDANPEGLSRIGWVCGGVIDDFKRRFKSGFTDRTRVTLCGRKFMLPCSDWTDSLTSKTLSSTLFMFFATFCSTVALGVVIQKQTHNMIGIEEYLIMNSIAGMVHALFGCQPLLVLRPTGPITAIIGKIYQLALVCNLDFWQYLAATGYFVGFYMFIVAAFELSRWIKYLTRFTHEIFNFFVCSIYVHDGITGVLDRFTSGEGGERKQKAKLGVSIFSTLIAIITFIVALWLNSAHTWRVGTFTIRKVLRDYAVTIAVLVSVGVSYIFELYDTAVERIALPLVPGPTCVHARNPANSTTWSVWPPVGMEDASCAEGDWDCFCLGADVDAASTSVGRPWFISFANAPLKLWPIAAATALPIVFFFFMDQNTSSLLCQKPYMFLKKGSYYHSSFLAMGIFNFISPSFGLPFVTGSLPHSPQLVRALTDVAPADSAARGAEGTDDGGESLSAGFLVADAKSSSSAQKKKKSVLEFRVFENRLAPFLMYLLIGMPVFVPKVMTYVPDGAVDGVLTFVGVAGIISDNQLWERIVCLITVPANFPSFVRPLRKKWWKVHLYTIIQLTLLALAWGVNLSPAGLLFSVIIVAIVPFNKFVMPLMFTAEEIAILDSEQGDEAESNPHVADLRETLDSMLPSRRQVVGLREGAAVQRSSITALEGGNGAADAESAGGESTSTTEEVMDNRDLPEWLHKHIALSAEEEAELCRAREIVFERAKVYSELRDLHDQVWCALKED